MSLPEPECPWSASCDWFPKEEFIGSVALLANDWAGGVLFWFVLVTEFPLSAAPTWGGGLGYAAAAAAFCSCMSRARSMSMPNIVLVYPLMPVTIEGGTD